MYAIRSYYATEIPKAILNTRMVDAFMGILVKPIIAAVKISGIILGVSDIITILHEENMMAINVEINKMASPRLENRFFRRY